MPRPVPPGLQAAWNSPLSSFASVQPPKMSPGLRERHQIYSLVVLSLLAQKWNGNKYGNPGNYGSWRTRQLLVGEYAERDLYEGATYLGHNIAALAVDARGNIVDYEFNHNEVFNSSVEHAEARLLRRLFSLSRVSEWSRHRLPPGPNHEIKLAADFDLDSILLAVSQPPDHEPRVSRLPDPKPTPYSKLLTDVTIYTSLESCAQCSGIMALADVREVVYLQPDQGQYLIGNMMFKATSAMGVGARAPWPIPASAFGLRQYDKLDAAYAEFADRVPSAPFFVNQRESRTEPSVTSFLCTDLAFVIASSAASDIANLDLQHPTYQRTSRDGKAVPGGASNETVVNRARAFLEFIRLNGDRGTAHGA